MIYASVKGARVPALGFGTWELRGEDCRDSVEDALAVGYRHIDTAQMYGNEAEVGTALRNAGVDRADIFLTTKIWHDKLASEDVGRSTEESLRRLKTEYVDLLLIHWPSERVPLEQTLDAMLELQQAGKTRHIGVSNFTPELFSRAAGHAPDFCIQVEYHPFLSQQPLLALARQVDALLTAYSPVARGRVLSDPTIKEIGGKHGKNPVQVTLRWLLQQENVAAIPKAASPEHRRSNFDVFDFELNEEEMRRMSNLARGERLVSPRQAPWNSKSDLLQRIRSRLTR
jgi:2,5-diketo-D-gluconate reductase B